MQYARTYIYYLKTVESIEKLFRSTFADYNSAKVLV